MSEEQIKELMRLVSAYGLAFARYYSSSGSGSDGVMREKAHTSLSAVEQHARRMIWDTSPEKGVPALNTNADRRTQ